MAVEFAQMMTRVVDGSDAPVGDIGEFVAAAVPLVTLTTATAANVAQISLAAGDWDVSGAIAFTPAAGAAPTQLACMLSLAGATPVGFADTNRASLQAAFATPDRSSCAWALAPIVGQHDRGFSGGLLGVLGQHDVGRDHPRAAGAVTPWPRLRAVARRGEG
jgi:hypothetical protein